MGCWLIAQISVPDWLPWTLMAAGGAMVIAVVLWLAFTRRAELPRRTPAQRFHPAESQAPTPSKPAARTPDPTELAEVKAAADLLLRQLDERAQRLERLIAEADVRTAALARVVAHGGPPSGLGTLTPPPAPGPPMSGGTPAPTVPEPDEDLTTRQILTLAAQGLSTLQIAQRTGQGIGMVELVLALRR